MKKHVLIIIIIVCLSFAANASEDYMSPPIPVKTYPQGSEEQVLLSKWFGDIFIQMAMQTSVGKIIGEDTLRSLTANDNIVIVEHLRGAAGINDNGEIAIQFTEDYGRLLDVIIHEKAHSVTSAIVDEKNPICEGYAVLIQSRISGKHGIYAGNSGDYSHQRDELEWLESIIGAEAFWTLSVKKGGLAEISKIFESKQNVITFNQFVEHSSNIYASYNTYGHEGINYSNIRNNTMECLNYISEHPKFDKNNSRHDVIRKFYSGNEVDIERIAKFLSSVWGGSANDMVRFVEGHCEEGMFRTVMTSVPIGDTLEYEDAFARYFWALQGYWEVQEFAMLRGCILKLRASELKELTDPDFYIGTITDRMNIISGQQLEYALGHKINVIDSDWVGLLTREYNEKFGNGDNVASKFAHRINTANETAEIVLKGILEDCYVSRAKRAKNAAEVKRIYMDVHKFYLSHKEEISHSVYADAIYQSAFQEIRKEMRKPIPFFEKRP